MPWAPTAPAMSGRPFTNTAASGGFARVRNRRATDARRAPPAERSRACRATAEPAAAIAAARTPRSSIASTRASVMACRRGRGLLRTAAPPRCPRPRPRRRRRGGACRRAGGEGPSCDLLPRRDAPAPDPVADGETGLAGGLGFAHRERAAPASDDQAVGGGEHATGRAAADRGGGREELDRRRVQRGPRA